MASVESVNTLTNRSEDHIGENADVNVLTLEVLATAKKLPLDLLMGFGCSDAKRAGKSAVRIPYLNEQGEEVAVRFRVSLAGKRFEWRRGDKTRLYGLDRLKGMRAAGWILLVEGESDCWTGWHYGLPLLGLPGKTNWRHDWARYFDGLEVYLWQEPDAADLVERVARDIPALRVIEAPGDAKDISEAHISGLDVPTLIDELKAKARPAAEILRERATANLDEIKEKAAPVLTAANPLALVARTIRGMGYGGNIRAPLLVYLAATSRLLFMRRGSMPVHLLLVGQPSAGKSYLVGIVLSLLPQEAHHSIDAGSPRALIYDDAELQHRVLMFGEADSLPAGEDNPAASAVRNLLQDHQLHYDVTVRDPETGDFTVRKIEKPGPTVLITTAVRRLGAQLDSRLFSLDVPDDQNQIRNALRTQAALELYGIEELSDALPAFQAVLQAAAPWDVVVPYADQLAENIGKSPVAARILRDYARLLSLIKSVTILNHRRRQRDADGRLVSEMSDYAIVYGLVRDVYAASVSGAGQGVRQAVEAVKALKTEGQERVRISDVAKKLAISGMAASRAIKVALKGDWLVNNETRKRCPADLDVGEPLPDKEGLPQPGLLDVNRLTTPVSPDDILDQEVNTLTPLTDGDKDPALQEAWEGAL